MQIYVKVYLMKLKGVMYILLFYLMMISLYIYLKSTECYDTVAKTCFNILSRRNSFLYSWLIVKFEQNWNVLQTWFKVLIYGDLYSLSQFFIEWHLYFIYKTSVLYNVYSVMIVYYMYYKWWDFNKILNLNLNLQHRTPDF